MSEVKAAPEQEPAQSVFNIEKLYVKDLSLEIPHAPGIFLESDAPQIDLQLNTSAVAIEDGLFEVTVTATVTAKLVEKEKVMFLVEVKQAGVFQVRNIPEGERDPILAVVCPNILYPYLREVVSDVVVRAGFAPVILSPINFDALYQQKNQQEAESEVKH